MGEVIDFASVQKEKDIFDTVPAAARGQGADSLRSAYDYWLNARFIPIIRKLNARNLSKTLGYIEALLLVQENAEGANAFAELISQKEKAVVDQGKIEDVKTYVYKADKALRETGKRSDYISPLFLLTFRLAQDIIASKDFEIIDCHTVKLNRKAITKMKELREQAQIIDEACRDKDIIQFFQNRGLSRALLYKTSVMLCDILNVNRY